MQDDEIVLALARALAANKGWVFDSEGSIVKTMLVREAKNTLAALRAHGCEVTEWRDGNNILNGTDPFEVPAGAQRVYWNGPLSRYCHLRGPTGDTHGK